jgi:hypothetical protein
MLLAGKGMLLLLVVVLLLLAGLEGLAAAARGLISCWRVGRAPAW